MTNNRSRIRKSVLFLLLGVLIAVAGYRLGSTPSPYGMAEQQAERGLAQ